MVPKGYSSVQPRGTDVFCPYWHEFKISIAGEIGLLDPQPFRSSLLHFRMLLNRRYSVARTTRVTRAEVSAVRWVASHFCGEGSRLATDQFVWIAEAMHGDSVLRYDDASVGSRFQTFRRRMRLLCVISDFLHDVDEKCVLQGYYAARSGNFLPTFRDTLSVTSYRAKNTKNTYLTDVSGKPISHILNCYE